MITDTTNSDATVVNVPLPALLAGRSGMPSNAERFAVLWLL